MIYTLNANIDHLSATLQTHIIIKDNMHELLRVGLKQPLHYYVCQCTSEESSDTTNSWEHQKTSADRLPTKMLFLNIK